MDPEDVWSAIDAERLSLADLLDQLSADEWRQPSLCEGWTVRDVAGHLAWQRQIRISTAAIVGMIRARGNLHRAIHDAACRYGARPTGQLVAEIRAIVGSRRPVPGVTYLETLIDILVHGQDIAIPLRRRHDLPPAAAATAATRIWSKPSLFRATRKLHGLRFTATDLDWTVGDGPEIRGPIEAILLLLTGRPAAVPRLTGDGTASLATRLSAAAR